jgi:hypothetical protein
MQPQAESVTRLQTDPLQADLFLAGFVGAFSFFTCAHLARWAAAIFFRAAGDIVRLRGSDWSDLCFAHRARCATAILSRPAAEIVRVVRVLTAVCGLLP